MPPLTMTTIGSSPKTLTANCCGGFLRNAAGMWSQPKTSFLGVYRSYSYAENR